MFFGLGEVFGVYGYVFIFLGYYVVIGEYLLFVYDEIFVCGWSFVVVGE